MSYEKFSNEISRAMDRMDLRLAIGTDRKGKARVRDKFVFYKTAWQHSQTYVAIVQTVIVFLGLMDRAVENVNSTLRTLYGFIGLDGAFQFPVATSSFLMMGLLLFIILFGFLSYRNFGLPQRQEEINAKVHVGYYLLWEMMEEQRIAIEQIKNEMNKRR